MKSKKRKKLCQYKGVWIDEWKRRGNGDFFKLYKIDLPEFETPRKTIFRIIDLIRCEDEYGFTLSENQIFEKDPLPTEFCSNCF